MEQELAELLANVVAECKEKGEQELRRKAETETAGAAKEAPTRLPRNVVVIK